MSIFGPEKTRDLEQRLLELERKQRKVGKRYRGGCASNIKYDLWTELTGITFMGGDFLGMFDRLSLYFINEGSGLGDYRVFTRTTQGGAVKYLQDSGVNVNLFSLSLLSLSPVIPNNENVFIESWVWIDHEGGGGYALELLFYGRLEEVPKCYYYNINYLEH